MKRFLSLRRNTICGDSGECGIMENAFESLDLNTLKQLYEKEAGTLRTALINGASWDEMRLQRIKVTELAIELHRKRQGTEHPAGNDHRNRK